MSAKQNQGTEELYDRLLLEVGHLQEREEVGVRCVAVTWVAGGLSGHGLQGGVQAGLGELLGRT